MQALILAGGLGTRLRGVVSDRPKPMADVNGKPFLEWLIGFLRKHRIEEIILSIGYLPELITSHFGDGERFGVKISYSIEESPLGTGGAIRQAKGLVNGHDILIMNGDSILNFNPVDLVRKHRERAAAISMAVTRIVDRGRYGSVEVNDQGEVISFIEKGMESSSELINAGIYVVDRRVVDSIPDIPPRISLETDIFPGYISGSFFADVVEGFFIDIGIPQDYEMIQKSRDFIAMCTPDSFEPR